MRGISGGERRRLSIGCGVVGAPRIIALDEPTSGMSAFRSLHTHVTSGCGVMVLASSL